MYLDYDQLGDFIDRYFGSAVDRQARMVGHDRSFDSGYFDIVRFFGREGIAPEEVEIRYESGQFELTDPRIREFATNIEIHLRRQGRIYDGPSVLRIAAANLSKESYYIKTQACAYGTFAGCCFALDQPDQLFEKLGGTLREYYKQAVPDSLFEHFPLALCLGMCGMLILEEQGRCPRLLLVHRSGNLASLENSVGPSAAGSVDFTTSCKTLAELIQASLSQEIKEELGLEAGEFTIEPLAWAREIFRGEKPQLFCLIRATLSLDELSARIRLPDPNKEFDAFEFIDLTDDLPGILRGAHGNHEVTMNCLLVEEYLSGGKR